MNIQKLKQNLKKAYPSLLVALPLLTVAAFGSANGDYFANLASAGYGGQDSTYKHTFNGGGGTFNVSMTEREIDYTTPSGGDLICKPNDIVVANLGTMGTLTEADLLEAARNCQPNIFTLPHLVQAMREGKIFFGGSMLTLNPVTETPGGDDGDGEETPSYSPKITPSSATMAPGSTIDFKGTNFAHEEDVTVKRDGTTVGSAHADGGGNFTTGSMTVPSTPGTYTYTFTGETSATAVTSTITVS